MNAVSGTILVVLLAVVCLAPRRWALLGMMAGVFCLTQGHSVDVAGLNLFPVRILEAAAFGRVLVRRELVFSQLNRIDFTLLLAYNYAALVWILRTPDLAAEQFAAALDPTLCYLALRALVGTLDDLRWFLTAFVVLLVPFTALVLVERLTGQSAFTVVGAAPTLYFREGVPRTQGTFRHAITLGSVAATFFCLYVGLWRAGPRRAAALLGAGLCVALVALSNSGGPLTSLAAALLGWSLWPLRNRMVLVRRTLLVGMLVVTVFMKAPIWYLPFKVSAVVGGGGYHRGALMDNAWQDLDKWWLVGMDLRETASWFPYLLEVVGGADITNQFLLMGIRGGLPSLFLLIGVFWLAFRQLGIARASVLGSGDRSRTAEPLLWAFGVTLFVQAVTWLGVSYFDQSYVVWLMQMAALSGAVQTAALGASARQTQTGVPQQSPTLTDAFARERLMRGAVRTEGSASRSPHTVAFRRRPAEGKG